MATNPNRPVYQETIESTWGQSVADHVTRRYNTAAERDADLAALTLADLFGQLVIVKNAAGVAFLQIHNGAAWVNVLNVPDAGVSREFAGTFSGPCLQWGVVNITYPGQLGGPTGRRVVSVTLDNADGYYPGAATGDYAFVNINTPTGFQCCLKTNANAQLPTNTAVCFHWRALYYPVTTALPGVADLEGAGAGRADLEGAGAGRVIYDPPAVDVDGEGKVIGDA